MKKAQAVAEMLKSRSFVLITPTKAILRGQISDDWDGFLQIHSLVMINDTITKIIKEWEAKHGRNKSNSSVKKRSSAGRRGKSSTTPKNG